MKKNFILPCLLLTAFLCQCKKSKDEDHNAPDLQKGLLAYFPLNDNVKDSADDLDVVSTLSGITPAISRKGIFKEALWFDGGIFGFSPPKNWSGAPISMSVWLKCENLTNDKYIVLSEPLVFGLRQMGSHIGMVAKIDNSNPMLALGKVTKNKWEHFVGTYDGDSIRAYVNGELMETVAFAATLKNPGDITVGSHTSNNEHWKGGIDDLRFYDRVLTEKEIKILALQ